MITDEYLIREAKKDCTWGNILVFKKRHAINSTKIGGSDSCGQNFRIVNSNSKSSKQTYETLLKSR